VHRSECVERMLGRGFRAHPGAPILGCYDESVDMNQKPPQHTIMALSRLSARHAIEQAA